MKRGLIALLLIASAVVAQEVTLPSPHEIVGPPRGSVLSGAELDAKTKDVASLLRCPTCQGLSIYDSPAAMAINMREQVRDLLTAGYQEDQILAYFEASYGEFVRLEPSLSGANWLVWTAPILLALLGAWFVVSVLRKREPAPVAVSERNPDNDPDLEPYILKVRELAWGSPGRIAPLDSKSVETATGREAVPTGPPENEPRSESNEGVGR
ncbi:MAG TPA: cytochrome c-type biogenesis protein CcmH [Thermoanaerobaculia bacterium]|nr:cytochrome c-type biogenesis protein CcmH [Thermoanaerobaculia bacterium]